MRRGDGALRGTGEVLNNLTTCKILGNGLFLCVVITYITIVWKEGYVGRYDGLAKYSLASYLIRYRLFQKRKGVRISGLDPPLKKYLYFLGLKTLLIR